MLLLSADARGQHRGGGVVLGVALLLDVSGDVMFRDVRGAQDELCQQIH